jgi:hypothetical protein
MPLAEARPARYLGGCFFFQSGSSSPRAQLSSPSSSFRGAVGMASITSNISLRSELGSCSGGGQAL